MRNQSNLNVGANPEVAEYSVGRPQMFEDVDPVWRVCHSRRRPQQC